MSSTLLPYRLEMDNGKAVVALLPELNSVPWSDIEKIGTEIVDRLRVMPHPNLLIDLCRLDYMGSAQVALVVRVWKSVKERNGRMVVANQHEMVLQVLQLARLDKVWQIVGSRDQGLNELGWSGLSSSSTSGGSPGIILYVAVAGLAMSISGIALHFVGASNLPSGFPVVLELGGALIAFLSGFWGLVNARGSERKSLSILTMVATLFLLGGVFWAAKSDGFNSKTNLTPSPEAVAEEGEKTTWKSPKDPAPEEPTEKESGK